MERGPAEIVAEGADGTGRATVAEEAAPTSWRRVASVGVATWFVGLAVPMGLFLVLAIPPGQGIDEPNHFYRAYTISEGELIAPRHGGRVGGFVPQCVNAYIHRFEVAAGQPQPYPKREFVQQPPGCSSTASVFVPFENTATYPPIAYLPQATAMAIARLAGAPVPAVFYAGRLFALATFVALMLAALRVAPMGRSVFFLFGVWPMSILQASTFTADTVTIGCGLLLTALTLRSLTEREPSWREFLLAVPVAGALAVAKLTYVLVAPLLLLFRLPAVRTRLTSGAVKVAALVAIVAATAAWFLQVNDISQAPWFPAGWIDPHAREAEILHRPLWFARLMIDTLLVNQTTSLLTWQTFVGQVSFFRNPARGPGVPPPLIMVIGYGLVLQAYLRDTTRKFAWSAPSVTRALLPLALVAINVAAPFAAVYVQSTPADSPPIFGGRYLLPLAALPLVSLCVLAAGPFRRSSVLPLVPFVLAMYAWLAARAIHLFY